MNPTKKATIEAEAPPVTEKAYVFESAATLYAKGVERLAEVQKKSIDIALQQSADVIAAWRKAVDVVPGSPAVFLLDLAGNAFDRFAETQKGAIDLVVEQSSAMAGLLKERTDAVSKATGGTLAVVQQTLERSVAAQKKALDYSAAQTKAGFETVKKQFGIAGTPAEAVADSFQRGVDALVENQKELLDIAAKPFQSVH